MSSDVVTYLSQTLDDPAETSHGQLEPALCLRETAGEQVREIAKEASDEQLLSQVSEGQQDALAILYQRHGRSIRNIARRILREEAEAEELLQEIFLYLSRKAALFKASRGSARSWIYHVAYHRAFDRRRYLKSRHFYDIHNFEDSIFRDRGRLNESLFHQIAAKDLMEKFESYLSPEQQQTIQLHFVEGYSLREIAEQTGQTLGNVRNHYYRGLERLRSHILKEKVQAK